ncbi:MAG TPA: M57 family metalloprotease [Longimicrobium sp.]
MVGSILLLAACGDEAANVTASTPDPLVARIAAMGFSTLGLRDAGSYYVVEGDIMLRKADLRARPAGPRLQYATTDRVSSSVAYDIDVKYSAVSSVSSAWATAITSALGQWNSIPGARVLMRTAGTSTTPDVTIDFSQCPDAGTIACASFPTSGGGTGPIIHIDPDFQNQLSSSEKLWVMVHELGHTLGFRHTNWNNRCYPTDVCSEEIGTEGAEHIDGTPVSTSGSADTDPTSVMMSNATSFNGFSYYDRWSARVLFPGGLGPNASGTLSGGHPVISWPAMGDASSYQVYKVDTGFDPFTATYTTWYTYVGSTLSTSYTDATRTFSNVGQCSITVSGYSVRAVFPDGTVSSDGNPICYS